MKIKTAFVLGVAALLLIINSGLVFSQESGGEYKAMSEIKTEEKGAISDMPLGPEIQWAWGEVLSVDAQKNEFVIKYLDYDTDQEKQMVIKVDDKTTFENIKSLSEIKPQDNAGIDYTVTAEGKNVAKNISVETPESLKSGGELGAESVTLPATGTIENTAPAAATTDNPTVASTETTKEIPQSEE